MNYAHSRKNASPVEWQTLDAHLLGVADLAGKFASAFGSSKWARLVGLVHDIGKARKSFQSYLLRCNGIEDSETDYGGHSHSGAGACWLSKNAGQLGQALSYCVAGHHAGLPDWSGGDTPDGALVRRLEHDAHILDDTAFKEWLKEYEEALRDVKRDMPFTFRSKDSSLSFWIRMISEVKGY